MEILRRTLSALLALVMVVTMLPLSARAEETDPTITETAAETEPVAVGDGVLDVPLTDETETVETVPQTTAPEVFAEGTQPVEAAWFGGTIVDQGTYGGTEDAPVTWKLDSQGTLTISGTGHMTEDNYAPPWNDYDLDIKKQL